MAELLNTGDSGTGGGTTSTFRITGGSDYPINELPYSVTPIALMEGINLSGLHSLGITNPPAYSDPTWGPSQVLMHPTEANSWFKVNILLSGAFDGPTPINREQMIISVEKRSSSATANIVGGNFAPTYPHGLIYGSSANSKVTFATVVTDTSLYFIVIIASVGVSSGMGHGMYVYEYNIASNSFVTTPLSDAALFMTLGTQTFSGINEARYSVYDAVNQVGYSTSNFWGGMYYEASTNSIITSMPYDGIPSLINRGDINNHRIDILDPVNNVRVIRINLSTRTYAVLSTLRVTQGGRVYTPINALFGKLNGDFADINGVAGALVEGDITDNLGLAVPKTFSNFISNNVPLGVVYNTTKVKCTAQGDSRAGTSPEQITEMGTLIQGLAAL